MWVQPINSTIRLHNDITLIQIVIRLLYLDVEDDEYIILCKFDGCSQFI